MTDTTNLPPLPKPEGNMGRIGDGYSPDRVYDEPAFSEEQMRDYARAALAGAVEPVEANTWRVEYNNDTGPNDEGFWEWWEVTDDARTFKANTEADANFLRAALSTQAAPVAGWQPIETAPKDMGTYLFLCNGVVLQGFRDATGALCVCLEAGASGHPTWRQMRRAPTHWAPTLAAPKPSTEGQS